MNFLNPFARKNTVEGKINQDQSPDNVIDIRNHHSENNAQEKSALSELSPESQRPKLNNKALYGLAGYFVALATDKSEADPAAVLITFLTRFAVECDSSPYLMIGDSKHYARIFSIIVGASSKARKGTSGKPVGRLFEFPKECSQYNHVIAKSTPGPLSSGEGIIYAVRDKKEEWNAREGKYQIEDPGVEDKRLFIHDEEFASALSCTKREGNILSTIVRCAWDNGSIAPLTKTSKISTTNAHIGICSHITQYELDKKMNDTEAFNGFANRFLWCHSHREKLVPFPEPIPDEEIQYMQKVLLETFSKVQNIERMAIDDKAKEFWIDIYPELSREHPGLAGTIINRAEAQVIRLSMIYALLDGNNQIGEEHLKAALSLWEYCKKSAQIIFSNRYINPLSQRILLALESGPKSTTELFDCFSRRKTRNELHRALAELISNGEVMKKKNNTSGRPKDIYQLIATQ